LELYRKCLSYIDNKIFDDERVLLMNQLELLAVNKKDARIIAIETGSSQTVVNSIYLKRFGYNMQLQVKIRNIICKFYMCEF